jgi:hypothetical protein
MSTTNQPVHIPSTYIEARNIRKRHIQVALDKVFLKLRVKIGKMTSPMPNEEDSHWLLTVSPVYFAKSPMRLDTLGNALRADPMIKKKVFRDVVDFRALKASFKDTEFTPKKGYYKGVRFIIQVTDHPIQTGVFLIHYIIDPNM